MSDLDARALKARLDAALARLNTVRDERDEVSRRLVQAEDQRDWFESQLKHRNELSQPGPGAALLRVVAQARTVARHWRDQDGVNVEEIDALCDAVEALAPRAPHAGDQTKKPPQGLLPRWRWLELRQQEIIAAMARYVEGATEIPEEWVEELRKVTLELKRETAR